ncbi:TolC family protein [Rhodohalobacter sp. 8-1]|uniref:TolC family protein n=1 Tax=Rhodohalobacter sp. 8-1 TaxID=3131972 RepID=UPI0030EE3D91
MTSTLTFKGTAITALFLGLCLSLPTASAQEIATEADTLSRTFNLEQAIQTALANNTEMKRALLDVRTADQDVRSAWGNVMPQVAASANYTRNLEIPVNFIPETAFDPQGDPDALVPIAFGTDNNWNGGLSVSQTLFSGQAFVGISSSELFKAAQSENLRAISQGVVTQTRIAYYRALAAKESLRLIEAQAERVRENLEDTRKRAEQGFVDDYAVLQLEVQLGNLQPQITRSRFSVDSSLRDLLDAMGLPVQLSIDVRGDLSSYDINDAELENSENASIKKIDQMIPRQVESDSLFTEKALQLRGDLRILQVQEDLRGKQLDAERSRYLPNISANYNLQWNASQAGQPVFFGNPMQRARSQTISVGVQIPIFQGFQRSAAVQQAKIEVKDVQLQQFQAKQTANKEILSAAQAVREALQTSDAIRDVREQAQIGYERALVRYQNGLGSQQEINDANLQLQEAEINYAQTISNYLSAKAQYDQAIGQVPFVGQDVSDIQEKITIK